MSTLLIVLLVLALILGGFGLFVKGLIVLLWIGVILLIADLLWWLVIGHGRRRL